LLRLPLLPPPRHAPHGQVRMGYEQPLVLTQTTVVNTGTAACTLRLTLDAQVGATGGGRRGGGGGLVF
jgi:hypothetical protein